MRLVAAVLASVVVASCVVASSSLARAQSACHEENAGTAFNDAHAMGGAMVGIRFVAGAAFQAFRVDVWTGESSGVHEVGLWAHDPNTDRPAYALATGTFQVALANGWQGATLSGTVPLAAGATYWVTWKPTAGSQMSIDVLGAVPVQVYRASSDGGQTWSDPFQFADRPWKFRIHGDCGGAPQGYCTPGTSWYGCAATITANDNPRVSYSSPCLVTVSGTEGQKIGIVFYALAQMPQPWCPSGGGTSFLCVKPPTMRALTAGSGGTVGACDGGFVLDWNQFQLGAYEALGRPWMAGDKAYVQCWFRDTLSCRSSCTSDAVELTYMP